MKQAPSIFQIMLWLWMFDCYVALPGPKWLGVPVSQGLVFVLGVVVGKWMLGYRESYEEYFAGDIEKVRAARGGPKKGREVWGKKKGL